ncbi:carbohydrate porin [Sphingomonas sp. SAFR-052]|uniref:carbohydrate porin n=1 Tax=Sphingomonas sp. SAFR-052 TaxID=3436867 RepID=UPI003F7DA909
MALVCAPIPAAIAQVSAPSVDRAPGEVEAPAVERRDPLLVQLAYTGDLLTAVAGGASRGSRWIHNVSAIATADLEQLAGVPRTTALVHGFYNNGASFSGGVVGDAQVVSSIEAGMPLFRLLEAWVEHGGVDGRWSAKFGLYDINSEFDALQTSLLFVNSAFGMGSDLGTSGRNGPSTFPSTGLALRGQVRVGPALTLRAVAADGVPNDPAFPRRLNVGLHRGEGALLIGEGDVELGTVRLLAGAWAYTARIDDRYDAGIAAATKRHVASNGLYLRGEAQLIGDSDRGVRGFVRLGTASSRANIFDRFVSGGIVGHGLVPGRPADDSGIAIAWAGASSASRDLALARHGGRPDAETAIELTHRVAVTDWLGVQPHVQYVLDPGLDPTLDDALVLGIRLTAALAR